MRLLVSQIRKHLIGQDAAVTAFAAEFCRYITLSPLHRRPGIFLIAGANNDGDHLGLPSGLAGTFRTAGGLYELGSGQGEDLAHIFAPISGGPEVRSLMSAVKDNPGAVFVLRDIDKAHPKIVEQMTIWFKGGTTKGFFLALPPPVFLPPPKG